MVIVWLIAFSQAYQASLQVYELCQIHAEEYCADNNCDIKIFVEKECLK